MNLFEAAHLNEPSEPNWRITHAEAIDRLREAEEIVAALPANAILYGAGWDRVALDIISFREIFGGRQCLSSGNGYLYVFINRIKVECFAGPEYRQPENVRIRTITLPPVSELANTSALCGTSWSR